MVKDIRVMLALVATIVLTLAIVFGSQHYINLRDKAQVGEQRGETIKATSGIIEDGGKADTQRAATDTGLATGKQEFKITLEEAKRNEPEVADRADRPVPASVRNAFRSRRLARERLGCAGEQCRPRPEAEDAAER